MYKAGQKVVCVNDKNQVNTSVQKITGYIKEGIIYEIKSFSSINGIRLKGVNHGYFYDGEEANVVHISKNYIKQEALKVMEVRFN